MKDIDTSNVGNVANNNTSSLTLTKSGGSVNSNKTACTTFKVPQAESKDSPPTSALLTVDSSKSSVSKRKTKASKQSGDLAVRMDVMNKNVFRAFKRECKTQYKNFLKSHRLSGAKSQTASNTKAFAEHLVNQLDERGLLLNKFDFKTLVTYIRILVCYCQIKSMKLSEDDKKRVEDTVAIQYSYSHGKFYSYIDQPEIKVLLTAVVGLQGTESFVRSFAKANVHKYCVHMRTMLDSLNLLTFV